MFKPTETPEPCVNLTFSLPLGNLGEGEEVGAVKAGLFLVCHVFSRLNKTTSSLLFIFSCLTPIKGDNGQISMITIIIIMFEEAVSTEESLTSVGVQH